ncbi:MAG TPA: hypothetical protein DIC36_08565 [Gammaproteobacteria bacterium]|nr:hypothetical protein [Gammaproteobacteria bacterium]
MLNVIMLIAAGGLIAAQPLTITSREWPAPHRTEALTASPPVVNLVTALVSQEQAVLVVRHAGGEAGERLADSLRQALVSLGVPSARLRFEPAAAASGQLILELMTNP